MQATNDPRLVRCLYGLGMSFEMVEYIHPTLHETCVSLNQNGNSLAPAFLKCWSFIDVVHRIREISQTVPGLSNKTPELKLFLCATKSAEQFRHYIQHLRKELLSLPGNNFPVWGSLSWVDPSDDLLCHTAIAENANAKIDYHSCVFDQDEMKYVSKVTLSIEGCSFNFDEIYFAADQFRRFIIPWILKNCNSTIKLYEKLPIVSFKFNNNQNDNETPNIADAL